MSAPESPLLDAPPLRRALFRALLFGVVCVSVFGVVLGQFQWTLTLWGISIGLLAAPVALAEGAAARRAPTTRLHVLAAALCGVLAAVGVGLGFLQVNYTEALITTGAFQGGVDALPRALKIMADAYFVAICVSFGAPFALVTLGRLRRWRLWVQTVVTGLGGPGVAVLALAVLAFDKNNKELETLVILTGGLSLFLPVTCYAMDALERTVWPARDELEPHAVEGVAATVDPGGLDDCDRVD